MGYFPFFMELEGKRGVIVGGGKVAARKVEKLLMFGPDLTVIAPDIEACVRIQGEVLQEDAAASLHFEERAFQMGDLHGADFVIAATDDEALNGQIADYCKERRIPVNVVDDRRKCTFFFPALVKDGPLTVGISTDGKSPLASSWVRREIDGALPEGLGNAIDLLGQIRPAVMALEAEEPERKALFEKLFSYCMDRMKRGREVTAEELTKLVGLKVPYENISDGRTAESGRRGSRMETEEWEVTRAESERNAGNTGGIKIGTRGSRLALRQAALVQEAISKACGGIETELVILRTRGDQIQDTPISEIGDKGIFALELEQALLSGQIDLAVHSAKDLPMRLAAGLFIAAVLPRADVRDVLVVPKGGRMPCAHGKSADYRPFLLGTGSRRRQLLAGKVWENVVCEEIRGNVDTRLRKLQEGRYDGIILAKAGLDRLGSNPDWESAFDFYPLSPELFLPAACQGIIAVEAVQGSAAADICKEISDEETELCYLVEREALAQLSADCSEAAAAWCRRAASVPEAHLSSVRGFKASSVQSMEAAYAALMHEAKMSYPEDSMLLDVMYAENRVRLIGAAEVAEGGRMARRAAKMVKKQPDWL